jgi:RNA polymerase sigma-70 factor (ECF subfamily)
LEESPKLLAIGMSYAGSRTAKMNAVASDAPLVEQEALQALDRGELKEVLTLLMNAYGRSIYRYCCQITGAEDIAEDVLQTTFLQAYKGLERFSRRSTLRTWLFRIAHNRCLDVLKMDRRRTKRIKPVEDLSDKPDPIENPETQLEAREVSSVVERCLQELAPRVRTAVLLHYQEGLSYPEMVPICGERPATLQARVARALPHLRRCVERLGLTL